MADEVATLIVATDRLPSRASDRGIGSNARQLLGGPVPRDDGEVRIEGDESIPRAKRPRRSLSHDPSLLLDHSAAHPQATVKRSTG